jgi:hypothetical protein
MKPFIFIPVLALAGCADPRDEAPDAEQFVPVESFVQAERLCAAFGGVVEVYGFRQQLEARPPYSLTSGTDGIWTFAKCKSGGFLREFTPK